ncbi:hypothetical protein JD276_14665 [Leucobacter sp. CSA1]|uniref:Uncharacterized protein n=1 Tax=Leucobacter chromiisoli TaxID=2796471 RepID=A0A934UV73_9MICO|nr:MULTISPECIES: hypothetical protein [Microbacteriaceae]MBK0420274.1 hypothetical protein [Leucobacter chromiisoli]MCD1572348.1 hypothetical protein [Agromyces mediolanus]
MSREQPREATSAVNWAVSPGKPDPIFGTGATRAEKSLANITGLVGAAGITALALGTNASWNWAQYVLAAILSFDVVGGVIANGLNSAKRDHFGSHGETPESFGMKLVRRPILFSALHLHPILIALAFAPTLWWWGAFWYLFTLAGTIAVRRSALYLQRPVALAFCALAGITAFFTPAPDLWEWLPVLLTMKLVLAHSVQEEPYRPESVGSRK